MPPEKVGDHRSQVMSTGATYGGGGAAASTNQLEAGEEKGDPSAQGAPPLTSQPGPSPRLPASRPDAFGTNNFGGQSSLGLLNVYEEQQTRRRARSASAAGYELTIDTTTPRLEHHHHHTERGGLIAVPRILSPAAAAASAAAKSTRAGGNKSPTELSLQEQAILANIQVSTNNSLIS